MPDPLTERRGVNAIEAVFLNDFKWIFREQAVSDFGIDAQAEVVEFDKPTGKLMALQIKIGASYFRKHGEDFIFYGEQRHLDYWLGHSLPVFLILHDPGPRSDALAKDRPASGQGHGKRVVHCGAGGECIVGIIEGSLRYGTH